MFNYLIYLKMKYINKIYLLAFTIFYFNIAALAQKKAIDNIAIDNWTDLGYSGISENGKYVFYSVENEPINKNSVIIRSIDNTWIKRIIGIKGNAIISMSKDSKYAVLLKNDSLVIIGLGTDKVHFVPNVSTFKMGTSETSDWLAYKLKGSTDELILYNIRTEKQYSYNGIVNYILGEDGYTLITQREKREGRNVVSEINWVNLNDGNVNLIWNGTKAKNLVLDHSSSQLVFLSNDSILYCKKDEAKSAYLLYKQGGKIDSGLKVGEIVRFNNDGKRILVTLKKEDTAKPVSNIVSVWSYFDHVLRSRQEAETRARSYIGIINIYDREIIQIEKEFENVYFNTSINESDTVGVITHQEIDARTGEVSWNLSGRISYYLVSVKTGKRTKINQYPYISPTGTYAVYFDPELERFVSFNNQTELLTKISERMTRVLTNNGKNKEVLWSIVGWLDDNHSILVCDKYDIWILDLNGNKPAVNLTNGYGRKNNITFSIVKESINQNILKKNSKLILSAFNLVTKDNGFYSKTLSRSGDPEILTMGPYIFDTNSGYAPYWSGFQPLKAKNASVYIVRRMSPTEAPNYFVTKDFTKFNPISNLHPEKKYNWYTTELHSWKSLDGKILQGILYKPENFDPNKKYPVIFYYYERKSDGLNAYLSPGLLGEGSGTINIPTYVSNGYLVFLPDIYYKIGDPMQGTYDAVISAANYVSNLPFIDKRKMGIQGCSWGGLQTNYLVTHSDIFAAACASSSFSNLISGYGSTSFGASQQGYFEDGQGRIGASLWDKPASYIKNSPIFNVHKVTTPVLLMQGLKDDGPTAFTDAVQFFTGLRRLGKKSWLLAYDGGHGLSGKNASDFSIRMMQFFDHYLKDKLAPVWMVDGIPASRRGLDDGLALDVKGTVPGPGILIPEEQQKVDSLLSRKPITITIQ